MAQTRTEYDVVEQEYEVEECSWCTEETRTDELVTVAVEPRVPYHRIYQDLTERVIEELPDDHPAIYKEIAPAITDDMSSRTTTSLMTNRANIRMDLLQNLLEEAAQDELIRSRKEIEVCEYCADSMMDV